VDPHRGKIGGVGVIGYQVLPFYSKFSKAFLEE